MLLVVIFCLNACTPAYHTINPISPTQSMSSHHNESASLRLRSGNTTTQNGPVHFTNIAVNATGAIVNLILAPIMEQEASKADQIFFGQADQRVFLRSLYHYLKRQKVFNRVYFLRQPKSAHPAVRILIDFKQTRVGEQNIGFPVILDASMSIKNHNQEHTYHYFINESGRKPNHIKSNIYVYHANTAARRLMHDIIR